MTIKVSEDFQWKQMMYDLDVYDARKGIGKSYPIDYKPTFKSVEVSSFEEIEEYVSKGYAIKINC